MVLSGSLRVLVLVTLYCIVFSYDSVTRVEMSRFENLKIVVVAHYFPPINSSGAKRFQYMSKYWAAFGAEVTVITTVKSSGDGQFTDKSYQTTAMNFRLGKAGRVSRTGDEFVPMHSSKPSVKRRFKDLVMAVSARFLIRIPFSWHLD